MTSTRLPQPIVATTVIGEIRGSRFPDRYIVVSAHFDHIGVTADGFCRAIGADSICNGADDNASGTAALLELARHFSVAKPQHSIIFAAFDAEEYGHVGSRAWVDSMRVPVENVLINVNMDMIGRNAKNELFAAGATKYPHLALLVNAAIGCAPAPITLISGHDGEAGRDDWTNQSDQGAFHRRGIPFIYFGEEDHADYHRAGDHPDRLMSAFYVAAARLVASFVSRFDANPVVKP
jgi:Zn-dependent M28 family amino/carboxypeptidase